MWHWHNHLLLIHPLSLSPRFSSLLLQHRNEGHNPNGLKQKKKNTHLSENGGGPRSEYYCTVKSRSQQLHISQEISLSMKNHVYHKNNTRGEDLQQKQQSGPFLGKGELGSFLGCYQMEGAPMSSNENTLTLRPCILSKIHHMPSTF